MKRKRTVRPSHYRRAGFLLFLILGSIGTLAVVASDWRGSTSGVLVVVNGTRLASPEDLVKLAGIPDTATLADVDLHAVKLRVERNPFVREALVRREPPSRLEIEIRERVPVAVLLNVRARDWFLDEEGYVIPVEESEFTFDLPVITGGQFTRKFIPGMRVPDARLQQALSVIRTARSLGPDVINLFSEIDIDGKNDLVCYTLQSGVPVILGPARETERKLRAFRAFWTTVALQQDVRNLEYVDLRFRDEVVVRWKTAEDLAADLAPADSTFIIETD